jgi:hypothetical protein
MLIKTFGLFWRRDEVEWNPGIGHTFRLMGRNRDRNPGLWLADFQYQTGIYILYGNHGAYYVGLTKAGLGKRLKSHDTWKDDWDRFSWFGFCKVLNGMDDYPFHNLGAMANVKITNVSEVIKDVEALLIRAMGLTNLRKEDFTDAEEWYQVQIDETETYLSRFE